MSLDKLVSLGIKSKNSRYRSGLEIAVDVLSIASAKSKKTKIMYQANLSYRLIEKYMKSLLDRGLLVCDDGAHYLTTARGKEFLQMYLEYVERCRRIGEDVDSARKDRLLLENMCFNNDCNSKRMSGKKIVLV